MLSYLCKPLIGLVLFVCLFFSCEKSRKETSEKQFTYEDFQTFLSKEMDFKAIVAKFGEPDRDIGSGIHIYVWDLKDSTEIWIGYVDKILYARHVDNNHNILHSLI